MAEYFVYNGGLYSTDELKHYGVKGMKWGVHKSVYKSMNKQQRKAQRQKYKQSPEGRIKRATNIGTFLGGPLGGVIANHLATKRINQLSKDDLDRGKQIVEKHKNTKIETNNKTKKYLESVKSNRDETDEQKITRLMTEGKTNPKAHYIFDQNGSLFMVTYDD